MAKRRDEDKLEAARQEMLRESFQSIMATASGRAAMWEILEYTGMHSDCIGADTHETYRLLGRREVGIALMEWVALFPESFAKMFTENRTLPSVQRMENEDAGSESES